MINTFLEGGDNSFNIFKKDVNDSDPSILYPPTEDWWNLLEVSLQGGISHNDESVIGVFEPLPEEDISKIVTLTAVFGYAYLKQEWIGDRDIAGDDIAIYIDNISKHLPDFLSLTVFRNPEGNIFDRRKFLNFMDILLKHAVRDKLYREYVSIEMEYPEERYCKLCNFSFKDKMCPNSHSNLNYTKVIPTNLKEIYCDKCKTIYKAKEIVFEHDTCPKGHSDIIAFDARNDEWRYQSQDPPAKDVSEEVKYTANAIRSVRAADSSTAHDEAISALRGKLEETKQTVEEKEKAGMSRAEEMARLRREVKGRAEALRIVSLLPRKGTTLKESGYQERWESRTDNQGNVEWFHKEGVPIDDEEDVLDVVNRYLYTYPLKALLSKTADNFQYEDIEGVIRILSDGKNFLNLVILLKDFVTKAYQLSTEGLDYTSINYSHALELIKREIEQEIIERESSKTMRIKDSLKTVFEDDSTQSHDTWTSKETYFDHWLNQQLTDMKATVGEGDMELHGPTQEQIKQGVQSNIIEGLEDGKNSTYSIPSNYLDYNTAVMIVHMILYENKNILMTKINNAVQLDFHMMEREAVQRGYQYIRGLISDLWSIMYAMKYLYNQLFINDINSSYQYMFEDKINLQTIDSIQNYQTFLSTELDIWEKLLTLKFDTSEYKDYLNLYQCPTTFKKIFARVEVLKEKLEPSISNPPLIIMKHLHKGEYNKNTESHYKSNDTLIHEYELFLMNDLLDKDVQHIKFSRESLINFVSSPHIESLIYYYESLIVDELFPVEELTMFRDIQSKYKEDLSVFYNFSFIQKRMVQLAINNHKKTLEGKDKHDYYEELLFNLTDDFVDIKDPKGEYIHEKEYMKYWPERERYIINFLKDSGQKVLKPESSDLLKNSQPPQGHDRLQRDWLMNINKGQDPMSQIKGQIIKDRLTPWGDLRRTTKYSKQVQTDRVLRRRRAKALEDIDRLLRDRPEWSEGRAPFSWDSGKKRLWKKQGIGYDKYKDFFMLNQYENLAINIWGDHYKRIPEINNAIQEGSLPKLKEAFQKIDQSNWLDDESALTEFIETIIDLNKRIELKENIKLVVEDKYGKPMMYTDGPNSGLYYPEINETPLNKDLFPDDIKSINTIEELANFKLPLKIGKSPQGEDIYQVRPFLKADEAVDLGSNWSPEFIPPNPIPEEGDGDVPSNQTSSSSESESQQSQQLLARMASAERRATIPRRARREAGVWEGEAARRNRSPAPGRSPSPRGHYVGHQGYSDHPDDWPTPSADSDESDSDSPQTPRPGDPAAGPRPEGRSLDGGKKKNKRKSRIKSLKRKKLSKKKRKVLSKRKPLKRKKLSKKKLKRKKTKSKTKSKK
tara:strand:+ start:4933 stop:8979 length:4047 start_codon:yes stop_codon:yes gene_type:complete